MSLNGVEQKSPPAWQPFTPRGVAAFSQSRVGRLWVAQFVVALLAASSVIWFLNHAWFPVISRAISQLPATGEIRRGTLEWQAAEPAWLGENHWLALAVDLRHSGQARSPADVEVEFGRRDFCIFSLLGFIQVAYPHHGVVAFNQPELGPWWGAWAPPLLAITGIVVILGLLVTWALMALVYALPVWVVGLFANKNLDYRASWRLSGAALMPGALFLTVAVVCYGLGVLDLIKLLAATALHIVIGWVYLLWAALSVPRCPQADPAPQNPFPNK